ncbi:DUF2293 domain-containing protein [Mesorhizobium yinganensis]|uniref:DUF2293 domain-containing protein n=1 Tax=Mesorhizobium yinganensis TaxID=3157707 RepID=UPI003CCCDB3E
MAKHHPHCPPDIRDHIVKEVCNRGWVRTTLGQAVGIVSQNHIRHRSTNYERALSNTHHSYYAELRKKTNRKATEIIKSWPAKKSQE